MRTKTKFNPAMLLRTDDTTSETTPLETTVVLGPEDGLEHEVEATLKFEVNRWGRARCSRISMEATEAGAISGTALRLLPLARIAENAVAAHEMFSYAGKTSERTHRFDLKLNPPTRSHRGKRLTDEYLRDVAAVYTAALEAPGNGHKKPAEAVEKAYSLSRGGAAKQIAAARERGFLPKTRRGKAAAN